MDFHTIPKAANVESIWQFLKDGNSSSNGDGVKRIFMMLETSSYLNRLEANQFSIFTQKFHKSISKTLKQFEGAVVKKDDHSYLVVFTSATNAVLCALKIQSNFKYITPKFDKEGRKLNIGISSIDFDIKRRPDVVKAITAASRMCLVVTDQLVISQEVKKIYEEENKNALIDQELIRILKPKEETFLNRFVDCCEKMSSEPDFNVSILAEELNMGRSKLYRNVIKLTQKSTSNFIREFKLRKAIGLLRKHAYGTISEIAMKSGFKNPAHFSKCFVDRFGILPSKYIQQHAY